MFEGLFSPWHLAILVLVVFVVVGPRKIAERVRGVGDVVKRIGEDGIDSMLGEPGQLPTTATRERQPQRRPLGYRIGRRLRGRRRRKPRDRGT